MWKWEELEVGRIGSGKSDPTSFCCSQNYAAAKDAEVGNMSCELRVAGYGLRVEGM